MYKLSKPYLNEPEHLLTPKETKALLNEAEDIRAELSKPGLDYPPKEGYSVSLMVEAALNLTELGNVEEKVRKLYKTTADDIREIHGGSMKKTFYSPECTIYQHIDPNVADGFEEMLAQEFTAIHNVHTLKESEKVETVTEYELRFTLVDGKPLPVRIGEYRDLTRYENLDEEMKEELKEDFIQTGKVVGELMRAGEVAYAESVDNWENEISSNRAYDLKADTVVVTDVGELSENQFFEQVKDPSGISEEFAFEEIENSPFESQREFLKSHGILEKINHYFESVIDNEYHQKYWK